MARYYRYLQFIYLERLAMTNVIIITVKFCFHDCFHDIAQIIPLSRYTNEFWVAYQAHSLHLSTFTFLASASRVTVHLRNCPSSVAFAYFREVNLSVAVSLYSSHNLRLNIEYVVV